MTPFLLRGEERKKKKGMGSTERFISLIGTMRQLRSMRPSEVPRVVGSVHRETIGLGVGNKENNRFRIGRHGTLQF